ncbi:DUF4345 domain-containing protein [Mycolicibacterium sediminis]|nr:DUF4345 domain-containing protein [Mycolicibacterium sediminis]
MTIKTLRMLGWTVGAVLIALGAGRMLFSMVTIPGSGPVDPSTDSETRAGGALLIALGVACVWAMRRSPIPSTLLRFLAITMGLIAIARVISMVDAGMPHWTFAVSTVVELAAGGLTYWYSTMSGDRSATAPTHPPV